MKPSQHPLRPQTPQRPAMAAAPALRPIQYSAGIPSALLDEQHDLLDQLIHFAFDTLGAQQLELHVRDAE